MLEAITDFWKPVKKTQAQAKPKLADLAMSTILHFGYMPQNSLSGRKLTVTAINSYQFGADVLTSFVLSQEQDLDVSMIVADAQGEQYLAISRKLSISERIKLFEEKAIEEITKKDDATKLNCRDNIPELKGWLVASYKREIQGMRGFFYRSDFRSGVDKSIKGEEFQYTLLGSASNEHAIEIESYADGRVDVYATIYRRTNDISEVILPPARNADIKLVSDDKAEAIKVDVAPKPVIAVEKPEVKLEAKAEEKIEEKAESKQEKEAVKLEDFSLPKMAVTPLEPVIVKEEEKEEEAKEVKAEIKAEEPKKAEEKTETIITKNNNNEEKTDMSITNISEAKTGEAKIFGANGHYAADAGKQEIKSMSLANGMDNESIECDLRVANHIIDEAIRGEMRLSDVVRRIIELPVAHQEAVQIPITLADEDYSLLAIRYGISASDRNAIKKRIIQDLGDFSGKKKSA